MNFWNRISMCVSHQARIRATAAALVDIVIFTLPSYVCVLFSPVPISVNDRSCRSRQLTRTKELSPYVVSIDSKTIMKAWVEALSDMTIGDLWELYIPYELGYGHKGTKNGKVKRTHIQQMNAHVLPRGFIECAHSSYDSLGD